MVDTTDSEVGSTPRYTANDQDFLSEARRLFQFDRDCDAEDRKEAEDDNSFANATDEGTAQWNAEVSAARILASRPVQQWNRIPTYIQQICNAARQNRSGIEITPGDGGTQETAEFFQGRIRQIEYDSNASTAFDTARDQQVTTGRGFLRVDTEYIPGTFKQRACITPIDNQFSVVFDAAAILYDRSDATRCWVISQISKEEHIRRYGETKTVNSAPFAAWDDDYAGWIGIGTSGNMVQIAEYWKKEFKKRRLVEFGGMPVWKDKLTAEQYATFKRNGQITAERDDQDTSICQYIINGAEILKKTEWIGSTIPIVPLWGRIAVVNGQRRTFSLIRNAKDPQRDVNLYVSNIAEQIAMMPKTPWIIPLGGLAQQHEDDWANAGSTPKGFLYWQQFAADGTRQFEKPFRVTNEPPIQALTIGLQQAIEGIKSAMGIYDASLGARSNETSGVAIDQRRKSAEVVNYHFVDNEEKSRKRVGQILVEIIPVLDKEGSSATVRSEDGKTQQVPIGVPYTHPKTGDTVTHILTDGDYGVHIRTGPTFESRREEIYQRDTEIIKGSPELAPAILPGLLRADGSAGGEERAQVVERLANILHPGLFPEQKTAANGQPIPPEVSQEMQALQQKLTETEGFAKELHQKIETKQPELENQVRLKQMELEFQREKLASDDQNAKLKIASAEGIAELENQIAVLKDQQKMMSDAMSQRVQLQHEAEQGDSQRQHAADTQREQLAHQASESDQAQTHEADQNEADRTAAAEQAQLAAQSQPEGAE